MRLYITKRALDELAFVLPRFCTPLETLVQRWPIGLPQYYVGHELRVQRSRAASAKNLVVFCGNAYDGVGIPASIGSGRRAAKEVLETMRV
jgi:oxygen-dependent protoporphyrinogen oxidase